MRTLRVGWRVPLLLVPTLSLFPLALASRGLVLAGARHAGVRLASRVQRAWACATLCVLGVRIERVAPRATRARAADGGHDSRDEHGALLVANHVSWLDILVLAACWRCRFVAKSEIARWPLFGWLSRAVGTLFVARGRSRDVVTVRAELAETRAAGVCPLVFPEGRATDGRAVRPFHAGLLEFAHREQLPSFAIGLRYRVEDPPTIDAVELAWHDGTPLWRHVLRVASYRRVVARVAWNGPHAPAPRRALAHTLERAVAEAAGLPFEARDQPLFP